MIEPALDVLLSPTLWLCAGLGLACGLLFHIWRGGGWRWLLVDFLAGVVGFGVGQTAGTLLRIDRLLIGQVQVVPGILGAVVFLLGIRLIVPGGMGRKAPVAAPRRRV
ncbi:MAG: hypothetical protein MUC51_10685 [Anaerolineae bacterium]|jgi:uncharacterized membrane protein YjjP (DUF1212 family)|nr:hypothetical protein [Anaerolineae bacterium]